VIGQTWTADPATTARVHLIAEQNVK